MSKGNLMGSLKDALGMPLCVVPSSSFSKGEEDWIPVHLFQLTSTFLVPGPCYTKWYITKFRSVLTEPPLPQAYLSLLPLHFPVHSSKFTLNLAPTLKLCSLFCSGLWWLLPYSVSLLFFLSFFILSCVVVSHMFCPLPYSLGFWSVW